MPRPKAGDRATARRESKNIPWARRRRFWPAFDLLEGRQLLSGAPTILAPQVTGVSLLNSTTTQVQVAIDFNSALDAIAAQVAKSYAIAPADGAALTTTAVTYADNGAQHRAIVTAHSATPLVGGVYHVTLNGQAIKGVDGAPMKTATDELAVKVESTNTVDFVGQTPGGSLGTVGTPVDLGFSPPRTVVAADFNGDGIVDLATASSGVGRDGVDGGAGEERVVILYGLGDGRYAPPVSIDIGASVGEDAIYTVDWNHDGTTDIAVASLRHAYYAGPGDDMQLYVLLNDGKGNFTPTPNTPIQLPTSDYVKVDQTLSFGNFLGDGVTDVAYFRGTGGTGLAIVGKDPFLGYSQRLLLPSGHASAVGDLNGDGRLDVVSGNVVFLSQPGGYGPAQALPFQIGSDWAAIGDFTGDGNPDIVLRESGDRLVDVVKGDGHGGFTDVGETYLPGPPIAAADMNGDGKADLLVGISTQNADYTHTFSLLTMLSDGNGRFYQASAQSVPVADATGQSPPSLYLADLNGDGLPDALFGSGSFGELRLAINNGHGALETPTTVSPLLGAQSMMGVWENDIVMADFNGDGLPDLAQVGRDSIDIFLAQPSGGYVQTQAIAMPDSAKATSSDAQHIYSFFFRAADMNNDGMNDLVIEYDYSGGGYGELAVFLGHGNGSFTPAPGAPFGPGSAFYGIRQCAIADVNGDGNLDVVATLGNADVNNEVVPVDYGVFFGDGSGQLFFNRNTVFPIGGPGFPEPLLQQVVAYVTVGDFNGDGITDIVAPVARGELQLYAGKGDGTFTAGPISARPRPSYHTAFRVADVNNDGHPDLIGFYGEGEEDGAYGFEVYLNDGAGHFTATVASPVDVGGTILRLAIGDFNGDGNVDVAVTLEALSPGQKTDVVDVFPGDGRGGFGPPREIAAKAATALASFASSTVVVGSSAVPGAPTTAGLPDVDVLEDAPATAVDLAAAFADGNVPSSPLSYSIVNDTNSALFSALTIIGSHLRLAYAANASGDADVTVRAANGLGFSVDTTFHVAITAVNDAPSFIKGGDQRVAQNALPQSMSNWATQISAGAPDEAAQKLTFVVGSDNQGLFSVQPAIDSTGNLTYTPSGTAAGTATVSVKLVDDGGTAYGGSDTSTTQTFTITIYFRNSPPQFTSGHDVVVSDAAMPVVIAAWATDISPGPAPAEASQTVQFLVSAANSALFAVQPAISPSGDLSFTPMPSVTGTTTVEVRLRDSGGTANGGQDSTSPIFFQIATYYLTAAGGIEGGSDATLMGATFGVSNANSSSTDFSVSAVDWGDGTEDTSGLSISASGGAYTVRGSHLYTEEGAFPISVTVKDSGGNTFTMNGSAQVADAPINARGGSIDSREMSSTLSGTLATFVDANAQAPQRDYSATIDWGDQSSLTSLSGLQMTLANGSWSVGANNIYHAYKVGGTYPVTLTILDAGGETATAGATATVAPAPTDGAGSAVSGTQATALSATVAQFTHGVGSLPASDFTATIDWGDGTMSPGMVIQSGTTYSVSGAHTYSQPGTFTVATTVSEGGVSTVLDGTAKIAATISLQGAFRPVDDIYVIGSGAVSVSADDDVLSNDSGAGQLMVTATTVTGAEGGTFVFNMDGSFTYTPPVSFPGFDYANYTVQDTSGDSGTATVNVLFQHAGVVWKFYEAVLNRMPDAAGLRYWTNYFENGGKTGDMAYGFFESDELLNAVLGKYYQQYLLRPLDADGLRYWKGVWHATGGPEQIKAGFADSLEFFTSAGGTPEAWIDALYHRILNRAPDPAGRTFWLNYLQQQTAAGIDPGVVRYNVALGFFVSAEAFANDVTGWFNEYVQRDPTTAESNQYVSEMRSGATDRTIEQEITNLPEYGNNPPAPPAGTAAPLHDYYPLKPASTSQSQAVVAAKDSFFSEL